MPVQKIDPKVIFASNAPAIDNPPVFSDKTKGWDVSRVNDGRPTIKEMNKVQQDTDLKILWLNENSVTPYDESIDYPDGAVALKDGSFKQLLSGAWVEFLDGFANKDEVKRGIANRYDPLLTYNSGERVVLTNGDIVKSTIDGNTNDPNVDMTGWFNTKQSYIGEKSVSLWSDSLNEAVNSFNAVDVDKDEVVTAPISVTMGKSIHSNGHTVTQSTPEKPVFETISGSTDIVYNGVNVTQDKSTPIAGGTSNNHAMFKFHGGKFNAVLNAILDGQYGISFGYGAAQSDPLANRSTRNNLIAFVKGKLLQGMFIEHIGSEAGRHIGVCLDSLEKSVFHAFRFAGYNKEKNPSEATHAPCRGHVGSAITVKNVTNVFSLQNSSELNSFNSTYVDGADRVIHSSEGTVPQNSPTLHRHTFTARNILKAIYNLGINHSTFGFSIDASKATSVPIEELTASSSLGFNQYEGVVKDSAQGGAQFRYSHNLYNLQVSGSVFAGVIVGGGYGGGTLITDRNSTGVNITGSNNNLQIVSTNATGNCIRVGGNGNVLHIVTDGNVVIDGSGNIITGHIGGQLTGTGSGNKFVGEVVGAVGLSGVANDLKQLKGFSGVEQQSVTTDATGVATIALSNRNSSASVRYCSVEILNNTNDLRAVVKSISSGNVTIKLLSKAGADITAATTVTVMVNWSN
ncbi:MAG: hypothetical protein ABS863_00520 [Aerococcus urinaeequi]